ncbi:hypothetical protein KAU13_02845 [candidate division WOR-3 bacterium]|nr:hypothetical protein [candidate division WOR-3 bacterium]
MRLSLTKAKKFIKQLRFLGSFEKKTSIIQLLDMILLGFRYGFSPLEYNLYGFYKKSISRSEKLSFISNEKILKTFRPYLNHKSWIPILENKLLFFLYYSQLGFPVVEVYGFYYPERGFFLDGSPLREKSDFLRWLNKSDIKGCVVKPLGSLGGKGIMIFEELISPETIRSNDGKNYSLNEVISLMEKDIEVRQSKEDNYKGYIIEEKIEQDPAMNVLSGKSLNTIRVSTLITNNNEILIDFGMLRVGREGSITDNLHQGGYVVNINVENGSIGEKTFGYKEEGGPWIEEKEERIKDFFTDCKVPFWHDIVSLAKKAASFSPELRSVGWDIAISKNGPVLMEGNDNWDMVIAQVLSGGYLTEERREILKEYGIEFPR